MFITRYMYHWLKDNVLFASTNCAPSYENAEVNRIKLFKQRLRHPLISSAAKNPQQRNSI